MKFLKILFFICMTVTGGLYSQNHINKKGGVGLFGEAGYNAFKLDEVSDAYESITGQFSAGNIPVKTQKLYPGSGAFGGGFFFNIEDDMSFRIGLSYTSTRANSDYRGDAISADITGKIEAYVFNIALQKKFLINYSIMPFCELNISYARSEGSFESQTQILDEYEKEHASFSAQNIYLQPALGALYNWKSLGFYAKAGYKFLLIKEMDDYGASPIAIDLSGFFIMPGITITLN